MEKIFTKKFSLSIVLAMTISLCEYVRAQPVQMKNSDDLSDLGGVPIDEFDLGTGLEKNELHLGTGLEEQPKKIKNKKAASVSYEILEEDSDYADVISVGTLNRGSLTFSTCRCSIPPSNFQQSVPALRCWTEMGSHELFVVGDRIPMI